MKEFFDSLLFVITHSAYLVPALLLFAALGFWYGCVKWLPCAWDLELALEEYDRLNGKLTKLTLGEFFAFPREGKRTFEFTPKKKIGEILTPPEPKPESKNEDREWEADD